MSSNYFLEAWSCRRKYSDAGTFIREKRAYYKQSDRPVSIRSLPSHESDEFDLILDFLLQCADAVDRNLPRFYTLLSEQDNEHLIEIIEIARRQYRLLHTSHDSSGYILSLTEVRECCAVLINARIIGLSLDHWSRTDEASRLSRELAEAEAALQSSEGRWLTEHCTPVTSKDDLKVAIDCIHERAMKVEDARRLSPLPVFVSTTSSTHHENLPAVSDFTWLSFPEGSGLAPETFAFSSRIHDTTPGKGVHENQLTPSRSTPAHEMSLSVSRKRCRDASDHDTGTTRTPFASPEWDSDDTICTPPKPKRAKSSHSPRAEVDHFQELLEVALGADTEVVASGTEEVDPRPELERADLGVSEDDFTTSSDESDMEDEQNNDEAMSSSDRTDLGSSTREPSRKWENMPRLAQWLQVIRDLFPINLLLTSYARI
ncbi:unnamed protein product [Somion occarium]|uniref:Uncharacterized protein n=1 Tax=Somion occarium TaxID=3059160 RepID=A0ABP1E1U8_9APHY